MHIDCPICGIPLKVVDGSLSVDNEEVERRRLLAIEEAAMQVMAAYSRGVVHTELPNLWKALKKKPTDGMEHQSAL